MHIVGLCQIPLSFLISNYQIYDSFLLPIFLKTRLFKLYNNVAVILVCLITCDFTVSDLTMSADHHNRVLTYGVLEIIMSHMAYTGA